MCVNYEQTVNINKPCTNLPTCVMKEVCSICIYVPYYVNINIKQKVSIFHIVQSRDNMIAGSIK